MKKIRLIRYAGAEPDRNQHAWGLKITALGSGGAPSDIFVYQRAKAGDTRGDLFVAVASVSQLQELGVNEPALPEDPAEQMPYYRRSEAVFVCRHADEADETWDKVEGDVQALVANLTAAETFSEVAKVDITADEITPVED